MHIARSFLALGGLSGALGVALSAMAAHQPELPNLGTAANMLLFHAPAFLALCIMPMNKVRIGGSWALAIGLSLFVGDLASRAWLGTHLFPMAAPSGGVLMIGGWLAVGLSAFFRTGTAPSLPS